MWASALYSRATELARCAVKRGRRSRLLTTRYCCCGLRDRVRDRDLYHEHHDPHVHGPCDCLSDLNSCQIYDSSG